MPRIAMATSSVVETDEEASTTRVDDLIQRGRSQGHLSLAELRSAFDQAGLTPAEGRSILRELAESGVRLANELGDSGGKTRSARSAAAQSGSARSSAGLKPTLLSRIVNWLRGHRGTRLPLMPVIRGGAPVHKEAKPGAVNEG